MRIAKDGRRIDISLTVSPLRDDAGHVIGASQGRPRHHRAQAGRSRRCGRPTAARTSSWRLLAHELRNPLAPLRNGLQVMRLAGGDADAVAQARAMMDRQLGHMVRLDRRPARRLPHQPQQDGAAPRARAARRRRRQRRGDGPARSSKPRAHELTVSLPARAALPGRRPDAAGPGLRQPAHQQRQVHAAGRAHLADRRARRATTSVVSVRDDGIGIPAEALPSIFDMFSQVDRSIERATGGLGIGLALVKGLVEMHGGTSRPRALGPAEGSTFTVRLPALVTRSDPVRLLTHGRSARRQQEHGRRILVVDDNRDSAPLRWPRCSRFWATTSAPLTTASRRSRTAEEFRPEVILMDVGMPRLNGLRRHAPDPRTAVGTRSRSSSR